MKFTSAEIIIPVSMLLMASGIILGLNLRGAAADESPSATPTASAPPPQVSDITTNPYIPTANVAVSFREPVQVASAAVQPPLKQNPYGTPLPQVATRGYPGPYQQIGVLTGSKAGEVGEPLILPLYGRHLHNRSDRWEYYTASSGFHQMRLPIKRGGRQCIDTPGCEEIQNGDKLAIDGYAADFTATIQENDAPRQYPDVV